MPSEQQPREAPGAPFQADLGDDWVYDWNQAHRHPEPLEKPLEVEDQTLRDGLQSPSADHPDYEDKLRLIDLMVGIGIDSIEIGLPAAGPRVFSDVLELSRALVKQRWPVRFSAAARTLISDIEPIAEISHKTGLALEVGAFVGSSCIRQVVEGWDLDHLQRLTADAVSFAVGEGLTVKFVTEDTTRAHPDHLRRLYQTAIEHGAHRVCIADTTGHATPIGTQALVRFIRRLVDGTGESIAVDWHGHRDRDLAMANALAAVEAGADCLHGTALGIGERVGNTPMDILLVNLDLLGWSHRPLDSLTEYCRVAAEITGIPIPVNYPVFGQDAFRTATGVHAAAIRKAMLGPEQDMADAIYSGVSASRIGRRQRIEIGPLSGESNVLCWLEEQGLGDMAAYRPLVETILDRAKRSNRSLHDGELWEICRSHGVDSDPREEGNNGVAVTTESRPRRRPIETSSGEAPTLFQSTAEGGLV